MTRHELLLQVKELAERHLDVYEIASRLCIHSDIVQVLINQLNNIS